MLNLQYMLKSVNLLNLLLLAVAITAIACALVPLAELSVNVTPPAPPETGAGQPEQSSAGSQAPAYSDYASIAEQNVFHPFGLVFRDQQSDRSHTDSHLVEEFALKIIDDLLPIQDGFDQRQCG